MSSPHDRFLMLPEKRRASAQARRLIVFLTLAATFTHALAVGAGAYLHAWYAHEIAKRYQLEKPAPAAKPAGNDITREQALKYLKDHYLTRRPKG